jgi:hypothetical protein
MGVFEMTMETSYFSSMCGQPPMAFKSGSDPPKARKRLFLDFFSRAFFISYTLDVVILNR